MAKRDASGSVFAREEDGTIQITVTIPDEGVKKAEDEVLSDLVQTTEIPGFRKGNAPVEEIKKRVTPQTLLEKTLSKLLPRIYEDAIIEHKIRPILSPQIQLVSVEPEKDWQIRIITCEAPKVELGDYKNELETAKRSNSLDKKPSAEEKEHLVLETLLKTTKCTIPHALLDEEVNHRLASLVDQTQKLGLTVDQYLAQTGKTPEKIREEYKEQSRQQLHLVLALSRIAEAEKLDVTDNEIDKARPDQKSENSINSDQKQLLQSIILRRKALDRLISFV